MRQPISACFAGFVPRNWAGLLADVGQAFRRYVSAPRRQAESLAFGKISGKFPTRFLT
jgi:hypothetical protein